MNYMPELLAPAGNMDALIAAVNNGADAVYLGGKAFNARGYAANFSEPELEQAVHYAHVRGAKIHLTLNTLVNDAELEEAVRFLITAYNMGIDAVIVQDLGLARIIRECLPKLSLHASTQLVTHNVAAARLLKELGFSRVVLARELDLKAIERLKKESGLEIEVFAHGALCICYSGQCLMSSILGGRSGNRGQCAQPCRLEYQLVDNKGQLLVDPKQVGRQLLSPKDLSTIRHLPALAEAGVDALKIEGRAKQPEYVATVVRIYRQALDRLARLGSKQYDVSPSTERELAQVFNRGFTSGYLEGPPGIDLMSGKLTGNRGVLVGRIIRRRGQRAVVHLVADLAVGDRIQVWPAQGSPVGLAVQTLYLNGQSTSAAGQGQLVEIVLPAGPSVGDPVFKLSDARLLARARASFQSPEAGQTVPVTIRAHIENDTLPELTITDNDGNWGREQGPSLPQVARKRPLTQATVAEHLLRLGNTPYYPQDFSLSLGASTLVPFSDLNAMRRGAVQQLTEKRLQKFQRPVANYGEYSWASLWPGHPLEDISRLRLAVTTSTSAQARAALDAGADIIYFGGAVFGPAQLPTISEIKAVVDEAKQRGVEIVLSTERIVSDDELVHLLEYIALSKEQTIPIQVANLGVFSLARRFGLSRIYVDYSLYSFNSITLGCWHSLGAQRLTLSPELNRKQLAVLRIPNIELEYIVHGQLELMVSEYCLPGSLLGGLSENRRCQEGCKSDRDLYLLDRKGIKFPLSCDQSCRMHVFNAMDLCLIKELPCLQELGISIVRIEGRNRQPEYIAQVVSAYKCALTAQTKAELEQEAERLRPLTPAGFTRGHFYRGLM